MPEILHGSFLNLTTILQTWCVGHVIFWGIMFLPSVFFWPLPPQPILYKQMVRLMFVVLSEFWDKREYRRLLWIFLNSRDGKRLDLESFSSLVWREMVKMEWFGGSQHTGDMPWFPAEKAEGQQYFWRNNAYKSHIGKWDHWQPQRKTSEPQAELGLIQSI